MAHWVVEGLIARSPRPGYRPGEEFTVRQPAVEDWIARTRDFGVASIICLLDRDQLHLYDRALPEGLLRHYEEQGFAVAHIPTHDGQTEPFDPEQYEQIWQEFERLPKPVLVHCSAGFDRTGRAIQYILERLESVAEPT